MTIASEITRINNNIASAYTACSSKGATMPSTQNSANLATCINSISSGGSATLITKNITQNGTYNASSDNADGYSSVTVNVSGGGGIGIAREVSSKGVYQMPASRFTFSLPSNATDVGNYAMSNAFHSCTNLTSVDLSSLTTVSGNYAMNYAFHSCTNLTSVDLSNLSTVNGNNAMTYVFGSCRSLTSVDLSRLTTVSGIQAMGYAFHSCTNLTSANFNNLQTIGVDNSVTNYGQFSSCFSGCSKLTTITFPNLEKIYCTGGNNSSYGTFSSNSYIRKMYFPKLDTITYGTGASSINQNACKRVFYGCTALTELHFASANQSAIEASPGYSTAWGRGAGNVTIYFDL